MSVLPDLQARLFLENFLTRLDSSQRWQSLVYCPSDRLSLWQFKGKKTLTVLTGDSEPIVPAIIYYMLKPFFPFFFKKGHFGPNFLQIISKECVSSKVNVFINRIFHYEKFSLFCMLCFSNHYTYFQGKERKITERKILVDVFWLFKLRECKQNMF